jgi:predicted site-specific integrase-resolvase
MKRTASTTDADRWVKPPQLARELGVDPATVIAWIRSGELAASKVGMGKRRPRYIIDRHELEKFMVFRRPKPGVVQTRRPRQPASVIKLIKYF